jgi:hypothetical protein
VAILAGAMSHIWPVGHTLTTLCVEEPDFLAAIMLRKMKIFHHFQIFLSFVPVFNLLRKVFCLPWCLICMLPRQPLTIHIYQGLNYVEAVKSGTVQGSFLHSYSLLQELEKLETVFLPWMWCHKILWLSFSQKWWYNNETYMRVNFKTRSQSCSEIG